MQYEKTLSPLTKHGGDLPLIQISSCQRFHQLFGKPLYESRFMQVEKFHAPGFAPVCDQSGAYHIDTRGKASYTKRFLQTFGFYDQRAAVEDRTGYYHIDPAGHRLYKPSYQWVGNYQEGKCVVRKDSHFFHIDIAGNSIYQETYDYVGDFKDGKAVVYKDGQATHMDHQGNLLYNKWYKKLHVFHKGFAMAEDKEGWFHIDREGHALYAQRFKMVEPFYNGRAKVETFEGILGQIDVTGALKFTISIGKQADQVHAISAELAAFWKTYLTNVAVELDLFHSLPATTSTLSQQLHMVEENLVRLLRALWEIKLIDYDKNKNLWQLSAKGICLRETPFLAKAATMWARVAAEKNWLKITARLRQRSIASFASFKERERSQNRKIQFYQALLGYTALDTRGFWDKVAINEAKAILLFGIHSLAVAASITSTKKIDYYNEHRLPRVFLKDLKIKLIRPEKLAPPYDLAIFCRFLQQYDDQKVRSYFQLAKAQKIARLLLIETILTDDTPIGGAVDMNIMVETGGKLRTLSDWQAMLIRVENYRIVAILPLTDYLSVIDIRYYTSIQLQSR